MEIYNKAEFAKVSNNKEDPAVFTPAAREAGVEQGSIIYSRLYNTMLGELTKWAGNLSKEMLTILTEAGITPNENINNQLLSSLVQIIRNNSVGLNVGDIVPNISKKEIPGRKICDGSVIVNCAAYYPDFYNFVINNTPYVNYTTYQNQITQYGQCGFCGVNGNDIKVPTITRPISGISNINQAGQAINATADKHVHAVGYNTMDNSGTFLFSETLINVIARFKRAIGWNGSGHEHTVYPVDTYTANMVTSEPYDSTTEVRGKQVQYPYAIVIATSATSVSLADNQMLMNLLQQDATIVALTDSATITLSTEKLYKLQSTQSNIAFTLPTVTDNTILNQIMIQANFSQTVTIDMGTQYAFNGTLRNVLEAGAYNLIWEYDCINNRWIAGIISKAEV